MQVEKKASSLDTTAYKSQRAGKGVAILPAAGSSNTRQANPRT